jgi:hypothetical protein
VKKPVINVDDDDEVAGGSLLSPAVDLMSSSFVLQNAANALVTESATLRATFIHFHDKISGSLDKLMEFMVKEQAEAQEDWHAVLGLLRWLIAAAEGVPSVQTEIVPAAMAGNTEAGPSAAAGYAETVDSETVARLVRRTWTPLFLPSDENMEPSDEPYVDEAKGTSSGSEESSAEGSEDVEENVDEDVEEDEEEADEMDIDQTLRD